MKIEEAKKKIRNNVLLPKYKPRKWKHAINAGCYPYALDIFQDEFFLVGDLIGKRCDCKVSDEELIYTLKLELNEIGYEIKELKDIEEKTNQDEFKIFLQREIHTGYYHFFRQDDEGLWSHKFPGKEPIIEKTCNIKKTQISGWCFGLRKKAS